MSQIKKLEDDLSYLNRFMSDLQTIQTNLEARDIVRSYDQACEELFNKVRSFAENEISKMVEVDKDLAQNIQNFTNSILKIIADTKQNHWNVIQKTKCQVDLMKELLISTTASKDVLQKQIEESKELSQTIVTDPPPVHERSNLSSSDKQSKKVSNPGDDS